MPLVLSTGFGLLVREFYKRINPVNNRATPALTRGLYTATKRDVIRRKRYQPQDPFSFEEQKLRLGGNCVRRFCSPASSKPTSDEDWVPVYRFKPIQVYSLISRFKFVQTIVSVLLVPYQFYQYANESISTEVFIAYMVFAAVAPLVLVGFTQFFNRMIGVVAFRTERDQNDESRQLVRFGYLGFWGGRRNLILPLDDVLPLTDTVDTDTTKPIVRLDLKQHGYLLLSLQKCEVVDEDLAKEIFGSLKYFQRFKN